MVVNKKVTGRTSALSVGILIGVIGSLIVTVFGAAVAAWLIHREILQEEKIGYCAMIILLFGSIVGAWIAAARTKRLRVQVCLMTGGAFYVLLLAITALFFGGQYQGMGVAALLMIAGSGAVALLGAKDRKRKSRRLNKRVYG